MMNKLEEAIIYATVMHQGKVRKFSKSPYILHPLEVAQILATMTHDEDIITAGILHDIVEDTDGTLGEIEKRFGKRVAELVASESEPDYPGEDRRDTWKKRKEESLRVLKTSRDTGVKMLWLADKLSNVRSIAALYAEKGGAMWKGFHQKAPELQLWYYRSVAESVELSLNRTGAFKEFIKHINYIWPGTFEPEKERFMKYREVSLEGCEMIGRGAKGDVYRYDDELIIKVFNEKNSYRDVEQEIAFSRRAFVLGIPTAISFGIVSVGDRYGAMYELVASDTISRLIGRAPGQVKQFAAIMADLARTIHDTKVSEHDAFPEASRRLRSYIDGGIGRVDKALAARCRELVDALPHSMHLVHGDFHTNNVLLYNGEPLMIDMDRVSRGHPVAEISDLYYFYVVLGEDDPQVVEDYMGFSYGTAKAFFHAFLVHYLKTNDPKRIREVTQKASIISYSRIIRMIRKKGAVSGEDKKRIARYAEKIAELAYKIDTLQF